MKRILTLSSLCFSVALGITACGDLSYDKEKIDARKDLIENPPEIDPDKTIEQVQNEADQSIDQARNDACELRNKAYTSVVKDLVETKCIDCHVAGGDAESAFVFIAGNDAENTKIFAGLLGGDSDALVKKLDGTTPHGGGKQVDSITAVALNEFFKASAECE
jgi:hypothetical protein